MKKLFYYSLIMALSSSLATTTSCNDDDETQPLPINNSSNTNTETPTDNTPTEVEKFSVTIDLNGEKIEIASSEIGKNISIDFDEIAKSDKLKGYEILSITKDGVEIAGKQEVTANSEYKVNAIKYLELVPSAIPNDKLLYFVSEPNSELPVYRWLFNSKQTYNSNKKCIRYVYRIASATNAEEYEYLEESGNLSGYEEFAMHGYYLMKGGDNYYVLKKRYSKKDNTVKGYQTEWEENNVKISKEDINEANESLTIADEGVEYNDGIIKITKDEQETSYIYDGTYLYQIHFAPELKDIPTYITNKTAKELGENEASNYIQNPYYTIDKIADNINIYSATSQVYYSTSYFALYDWDGNGTVSQEEFDNTWVAKSEEMIFGNCKSLHGEATVYPDKTFNIYGQTGALTDENCFFYGNYFVFYYEFQMNDNK